MSLIFRSLPNSFFREFFHKIRNNDEMENTHCASRATALMALAQIHECFNGMQHQKENFFAFFLFSLLFSPILPFSLYSPDNRRPEIKRGNMKSKYMKCEIDRQGRRRNDAFSAYAKKHNDQFGCQLLPRGWGC